MLQSEAERRGKRKRKAVSYDHAYLTQDWEDDDFEEDEAAYQQRQAKRGQPTPGLSLYEVCSCGQIRRCRTDQLEAYTTRLPESLDEFVTIDERR